MSKYGFSDILSISDLPHAYSHAPRSTNTNRHKSITRRIGENKASSLLMLEEAFIFIVFYNRKGM